MHDDSSHQSPSTTPHLNPRVHPEVGCEQCGLIFTQRRPGQRFCSQGCYQLWWITHRQRDLAAKGTKRLTELIEGTDPEGERIRERIVTSNRERPRRRKPVTLVDERPIEEPEDDDTNTDDDTLWAERGQYWEGQAQTAVARPVSGTSRRRDRQPLILTGHGVRLQVHQGALVVRDGFTHYPQAKQEWRLFPGDRSLPSRIIVLDADGALSFDVIAWLDRQQIPLVVLDWQGEVVSAFGGAGMVADPTLRQAQIAAQTNGVGLRLAIGLIRDKIDGSRTTLLTLPPSPARELGIRRLDGALDELERWPPESIETLRLIEARAALAYFTCWQSIPLHWKGIGKKPIPPEWQRVGLRQSLVSGSNRKATHPVNAILNYAYGVLESQVQIPALQAGLDPTIGYLHANRPGRVALVYDLMEPLRPQVDLQVLEFVGKRTFTPGDFTLTPGGVCRLHPQLAKIMAGKAVSNGTGQRVIEKVVQQLSV